MNEPKLRFNGFIDSWDSVLLSDVSEINPKSSSIPDTFEYVDLESVVGTEIISHRTEKRETAPSRAQRVAQIGDIFYQTVRPYQKNNCYFSINVGNSYVFSTGYAQLRSYIDGYFLFSALQQERFVNNVLNRCTGTSYPAINSADLASISIRIPVNRKEQYGIGVLFRDLDRKIALKQKKYDALIEAKKGLLQKIFSREIRFKDDNGEEYPAWMRDILGKYCSIKTGKLDANVANPNGKYKFFTCSKKDSQIDEYAFDGEAILIAGNGEVGHTKYYCGKFNAYQRTYVLMGFSIMAKYLILAIDYYLPSVVRSDMQQGAMPYIKLNTLTDLTLPIPCLEEQKKIADFLSTVDEKIETVRKELDCWKIIKKGLLQQMFC